MTNLQRHRRLLQIVTPQIIREEGPRVIIRQIAQGACDLVNTTQFFFKMSAPSGQRAAGRGGEPIALTGGDELLHRLR